MPSPNRLLNDCRIGLRNIYYIGTFDAGVTVLRQQSRALNLVSAAIESGLVSCVIPGRRAPQNLRIAIVGGGFAGLTFAAGLISKYAAANITIFEERDVLLPLQHGSDSRWLHPQIYNWPGPSSEMTAAMLPIMNWTAARASDVAVRILSDWKVFASQSHARLKLYCNTRHLQIQTLRGSERLRLEWVGEERNPKDASILDDSQKSAVGASEVFDCVILAVGFGLERDDAISYWRNEQFAQPSLEEPRKTYLVSGQGDGAMIDLLRLRVASYRQDRILDELFSDKDALVGAMKTLHGRQKARRPPNLFGEFEKLYNSDTASGTELKEVCDALRSRLRRDTEVILRIRQRSFASLFGGGTSFQNRLLIYLLFKCGGFVPTADSEKDVEAQHSLDPTSIVVRHGTLREDQFRRLLSDELIKDFNRRIQSRRPLSLTDAPLWGGGFFGWPGTWRQGRSLPDRLKKIWRKEYLPSPTTLLASGLCAAIAGLLSEGHPPEYRLRVTLHRSIVVHDEELLQQACEYQGLSLDDERASGRTFPVTNATIGLAYSCLRIVRSKKRLASGSLQQTMKMLRLNDASSKMRRDVGFVLAIPLLESGELYTSPSRVAGVVYVDSNAPNYYLDDGTLAVLISIAQKFLDGLVAMRPAELGGVRNFPLSELSKKRRRPLELPRVAKSSIELVRLSPPSTCAPYQLNYDYSDFAPSRAVAEQVKP